jgi:phage-related protein
MGNSKSNIQNFPEGAQKLVGDELQLIQFGGMPKDTNLQGRRKRRFGDRHAILRKRLPDRCGSSTGRENVLHAFLKKSTKALRRPRAGGTCPRAAKTALAARRGANVAGAFPAASGRVIFFQIFRPTAGVCDEEIVFGSRRFGVGGFTRSSRA